MAGQRVVGWACTDEWMEVCSALSTHHRDPESSAALASLASAYARIRLWQARGKVPIAIETTANLVNALLSERMHKYPLHTQSLLLSFAIVRLAGAVS